MFNVVNTRGEILIANRPLGNPGDVFYNINDQKCYKWTPTIVDGVPTGAWEEVECEFNKVFNQVDNKYYVWKMDDSGGVLTGHWEEATE